MDHGTQGSRLPRSKCQLCNVEIIWVEKVRDGKKVPLNPSPVSEHRFGEFKRVGATNKVEVVPESERWRYELLYQSHRDTCQPWLQCKAEGIRTYVECRERCERVGMTQLVRENREPDQYALRRDL
jgi:hypothetical protein